MEHCSYFIPDKALFGSFPTQETVDILEEHGVRYFIDLTEEGESNTIPYRTRYKYIKYPIRDRSIPENWRTFAKLIVKVCNILQRLRVGEKMYVNCRGGHGRSGTVVACILAHYFEIPASDALAMTSKYHSERENMREKWRKIGSPQGKSQKDFVYKFFKPLKFSKHSVFNSTSDHSVTVPSVGTFANAHLAFQYYRSDNEEYVEQLLHGEFCPDLAENSQDWEENKVEYMYKVLEYKFRQHTELYEYLVNTGLRPIVKMSRDSFWGVGDDGRGKNVHGKLLTRLRDKFLSEN